MWSGWWTSVLFVAAVGLTHLETSRGAPIDVAAIKSYLQKFGYVPRPAVHGSNPDPKQEETEVKDAILKFQKSNGIPETGIIDDATRARLEDPKLRNIGQGSRPVLLLQGSRWESNMVTYNIFKGSSKVSSQELDQAVKKAFSYWSEASHLKVVKVPTHFPLDVDIGIRFETGYHNDHSPFDGAGGALAHTSSPPYGRVHLDDDEPWTVDITKYPFGRDLLSVLVHEIGHALGLVHSDLPSAVMYRYYKLYYPGDLALDADDVQAVQALYGRKRTHFFPRRSPDVSPGGFQQIAESETPINTPIPTHTQPINTPTPTHTAPTYT